MAQSALQLSSLFLPPGILALRAPFQCGTVGLYGAYPGFMLPLSFFECRLSLGGRLFTMFSLLRPGNFFHPARTFAPPLGLLVGLRGLEGCLIVDLARPFQPLCMTRFRP